MFVNIKYKRLSKILKRYAFSEKMLISHKYSQQLITPVGVTDAKTMRHQLLPWNLETFILFAVRALERNEDALQGKSEKHFLKMMECIAAYIHPVLKRNKGTSFARYFIMAESAVQFEIQEFYPYKFYRYHYYFTFINKQINMKNIFIKEFECDYNDCLVVIQFLWLMISLNIFVPPAVYRDLIKKYPFVFKNLTMTRQHYIDELDDTTDNIDDYKYCIRPSYSYPFIVEKETLYLPLPHLLVRSITSSLLYRITDGNDALASTIGKEVFEKYLHRIIKESHLFDEVIPEQKYKIRKMEQRTIDVMVRKTDTYIFFDSKSYSPKRDLRIFSEEAFTNEVDRLAKTCKQVYLHSHDKFPKEYNFFKYQKPIDHEKVFGLVVVKENPHILAELIYKKAAELIGISIDSAEYIWLCKHIGIVSIYNIEEYCFTSSDIVAAVNKNSISGRINDHWLSGVQLNARLTNSDVKNFKDRLAEKARVLAAELLKPEKS